MGGVLVPSLDLLRAVQTDGTGSFLLTANWPPEVPHRTTAYFQFWMVDPGGPKGFAASNALAATSP
jgi:hypothetical protein